MTPRLAVEAISHDLSEIRIVITASNDRFAGSAGFWMGIGCAELIDLAGKLRGFPKSVDQVEEWEYGFTRAWQEKFREHERLVPGLKPSIEYVHLKFLCLDRVGHLAVDITLHEDSWVLHDEGKGKVFLELAYEPAQIDSFCEELLALVKNKEGSAVLQGIPTP